MPYEPRRGRSRTRNRGAMEVNGQYRVTVPDPDALDRLRTRNRVYDRTLQPRERFAGGTPLQYVLCLHLRGNPQRNPWIQMKVLELPER